MSSTVQRESRAAEPPSPSGIWSEIDRLWLDTLGRVVSRAAHEVKGALNGVSVNLEVVRSRAAAPDTPASAVQRFAESAAQQLELLIRLDEAVLALARPVREPVDSLTVIARLVTLLGAATAAEGGSLRLEDETTEGGTTTVRGNALRLAVAAALLAAIERKQQATCRLTDQEGLVVRVTTSAGGTIVLPSAITEALAAAGVRVSAEAEGCSLAFPRTEGPTQAPGTRNA